MEWRRKQADDTREVRILYLVKQFGDVKRAEEEIETTSKVGGGEVQDGPKQNKFGNVVVPLPEFFS